MVPTQLPSAFRDLYAEARQRLPTRDAHRPASRLYLLPPTLRAVADKLQTSGPLNDLAATTKVPARSLSRLLCRSGFYHGVAEGRSARRLWADLRPHLRRHRVRTRILVLLDGCQFPLDRFAVPGGVVQRFSSAQIATLGPKPEIASVFFPRELLDSAWFSQQWFLWVDRARDDAPTHVSHFLGHDLLGEYWLQLLPLALYDVTGFNVPVVLEATRGWSLRCIRSGEPMIDADSDGNEIPSSQYSVSATSLPSFRSFLAFMRSAYHALRGSEIAKSVSRRYLRAIFVSGPFPDVADPDDADDAVLHLTFGLERLLLATGEREAIADKLALRAAYLVGLNDDAKREQIHALVKQLYGQRSSIVHPRRQDSNRLSPWRLRGLVRDLVVAFVALRHRVGGDDQWADLLRRVVVSRKDQAFVARVAQRPLRLVRSPQ